MYPFLLKKDFHFKFLNKKTSNDGRKLLINCTVDNDKFDKFSYVVVYAPRTKNERTAFFRDLDLWLRDCELHTLIMGGDFNTIINKRLDKKKVAFQQKWNLVNILKSMFVIFYF